MSLIILQMKSTVVFPATLSIKKSNFMKLFVKLFLACCGEKYFSLLLKYCFHGNFLTQCLFYLPLHRRTILLMSSYIVTINSEILLNSFVALQTGKKRRKKERQTGKKNKERNGGRVGWKGEKRRRKRRKEEEERKEIEKGKKEGLLLDWFLDWLNSNILLQSLQMGKKKKKKERCG